MWVKRLEREDGKAYIILIRIYEKGVSEIFYGCEIGIRKDG